MTLELQRLAELLQPAKSVLVVVGESATTDRLAAATALVMALTELGKETAAYAPKTAPELIGQEATDLIQGSDQIKTSLGKQNLVISFEYVESAVDKVSYAIGQDSQRFYLTIKPQAGALPLDPATVQFDMAGTTADLIILLGEHDLMSLNQLYYGYEDTYANTPLVIIHSFIPDIGTIHFNVADFSSYSEAMAMILGGLQIDISAAAATNLYAGMFVATKSFSELSVQAETFEIAAELLRRGARRPQLLSNLGTEQVAENQSSVQSTAALKSKSKSKTHSP